MENRFPLEGIKILDLTRLLPGPFATQYLADLGAEVLRIESPIPDLARLSPPYVFNRGSYDLANNRNKKSMNLNLKSDKAKYIFFQLVKEYDIVIEQFRPGIVEKLGVDYTSLKTINEDIIYCSLSGYGQTDEGPYRDKPAHDINYLSEAGFLHDQLLENKSTPFIIPQTNIPDLSGGISAVIGILSAVIHKKNTGKGQFIDVSIFDSVVHLLLGNAITIPLLNNTMNKTESTSYLLNGKHPFYTTYKTKDGKFISIGSLEPHFWKILCEKIGKEEFIDEQYNIDNHSEILNAFKEIFLSRAQQEWLDDLHDICIAPVNSINDLFGHEQIKARNLISKVRLQDNSTYYTFNQPINFSNSPLKRNEYPPPIPGEHTEEILAKLGYSSEEAKSLTEEGVIF